MVDKLMGSLARKAERQSQQKVMLSVRDLRVHVKVCAVIGNAIIAARMSNAIRSWRSSMRWGGSASSCT